MKTAGTILVMVLGWAGASLAAAPGAPATRITRPPATAPAPTADAFLATAPALKERVAWVTGTGKRMDYPDWSAAQKARLELFYRRMANGDRDLTMRLPTEKVDSGGRFFFTADVAFDVYAAQVAHVLYVESHHLVPWSLQNRPAGELDELLNSNAYFSRIGPSTGNTYPAGIQADRDFMEVPENDALGELIGDPRVGYDFLSGKTSATHKSLIGKTELETLANLSVWLRDNVTHGPLEGNTMERVKAQRWLEQRLQPSKGSKTAMAVMGCHSSAKLLVDLARSVNLPLLHARALDNALGDQGGSFFSHTHGSLIYNWGGKGGPRVLWHVDELNASPCDVCFPIDPKTGALATPEAATQLFFDEMWATPPTLAKAGFVYKIERVFPGQGQGKVTRGQYEDRQEFGFLCGAWKKKGQSNLGELYLLAHDYALCGEPLLSMLAGERLEGQLTSNIKLFSGDMPAADLPPIPTMAEFNARAALGLKALGGAAQLDQKVKAYEASRGGNLLVPQK